MKNTKKRIIAVFAAALALFVTFSAIPLDTVTVNALDTSVEAEQALKDEISSLKTEQKDLKAKLEAAQKNEEAQEVQKEYLDSLIFSTHNEIDAATELLAEYDKQIADLEIKIVDMEDTINKKFEDTMNVLYAEYVNDDIGILEIFLSAENYITFLTASEDLNYFLESDTDMMDGLQSDLITYEQDKQSLEEARRQQQALQEDLIKTKADLEQQLADTEAYIKKLQEDQVAYEADYQRSKELESQANAKIEEILANRIPEPVVPPTPSGGGNNDTGNISGPSYGGSYIFPMDRSGFKYASSEYGWRTLWGYQDFHLGIDLACNYGTPIYASAAGTVVISEWHYSYGYYVVIDHGNGVATTYAHNSQLLVSVGSQVSQGQMIAKAGSTGSSSGNHLHFEVRVNGKTTNPRGYISV